MFNDPCILGIKNKFIRRFVAWIITKYRVKAMRQNYNKWVKNLHSMSLHKACVKSLM